MIPTLSSRVSRLLEATAGDWSSLLHCSLLLPTIPLITVIIIIITINILTPSALVLPDLRLQTATLKYPGKVDHRRRKVGLPEYHGHLKA